MEKKKAEMIKEEKKLGKIKEKKRPGKREEEIVQQVCGELITIHKWLSSNKNGGKSQRGGGE